MKEITKTIRYWLFKPVNETEYYYIRAIIDRPGETPWWGIGYENHLGFVSYVGNPLSEKQQLELEKEFKKEMSKIK